MQETIVMSCFYPKENAPGQETTNRRGDKNEEWSVGDGGCWDALDI